MTPFSRPGDWNHIPRAAKAVSRGHILPMGSVLPIERVRRPLMARLFGGKVR